MKNDIFDFKRFGNYFVSDIRNAVANYGWSLLILICFGLIAYLLVGFLTTVATFSWQDLMGGSGIEWVHTDIYGRSLVMILAFCVLVISMPAKCYGGLTDKQIGSNYLLLPVSRVEKYISMLLICCVVIPFVFTAGYLFVDYLICMVCPEAGSSIVAGFSDLWEELLIMANTDMEIPAELFDKIRLSSAIDDVWMILLFFLSGALLFKRAKAIKTFLCGFALTHLFGIVMIIVIVANIQDIQLYLDTNISEMDSVKAEQFVIDLIKKATVFDTIFDITVNILLLTGIWFRLKTLKH